MKSNLEKTLRNESRQRSEVATSIKGFAYMSLWYASLYVVVEGWRQLGLRNGLVESLLSEGEYLSLLRRFRNGTMHYQEAYWDARLTEFIGQGAESASWVRELHAALGDDLLSRLECY